LPVFVLAVIGLRESFFERVEVFGHSDGLEEFFVIIVLALSLKASFYLGFLLDGDILEVFEQNLVVDNLLAGDPLAGGHFETPAD
jgi:hypothetical protein